MSLYDGATCLHVIGPPIRRISESPTDVSAMSPVRPTQLEAQSTLQVDFLVISQKLQKVITFTYGVGLRRFKCHWNQNNDIYDLEMVSSYFNHFYF